MIAATASCDCGWTGGPYRSEAQAFCDCGWTGGPYRSEAQALYALRRHSCDKHTASSERRRRYVAARAAIDRTPKTLTRGRQHGQYVAYKLDSCRCAPCCAASSAYNKNRNRRKGYGQWQPYVDAEPARRHLLDLQAQGLGIKTAARAAGLPPSSVAAIIYGKPGRRPTRRIRPATAQAILALTPNLDTLPPKARAVSSVGTLRRIQALAALGWTTPRIAAHAGIDTQRLYGMLGGDPASVDTARRIRATYDALWNTPPPEQTPREKAAASRARNRAAACGWHPPLAWDDIDDPNEWPDQPNDTDSDIDDLAVQLCLEGSIDYHRLTRAEQRAAYEAMVAAGWTAARIADATKVDRNTIDKQISRRRAA